jgi:hypothetical protein
MNTSNICVTKQKTCIMKKIFLLFAVITVVLTANAQNVAINNSGATADASAMLDISSTSKGLLIPRMSTSQKTAIASPARGLMVYDSDTQSFWYWTGMAWKEVLFSGAAITPTGIAGGDLYGSYPSPNVGKIQNLDVAFGVPFDKQIMKWDGLNNKWQGQNDSLFLPYNATFGSATKLFGITNNNTTNGATAVYGKISTGSGIAPALTIGVWGDNLNGAGVVGTSSNGVGTYGYSVNNHGAYGFTSSSNFAGVYGTRINPGPAVMGDIYSAGTAVYGKSNGSTGKAGLFENTNAFNADTVVKIVQKGTGMGTYMYAGANNTSPVLQIDNDGGGNSLKVNSTGASSIAQLYNTNTTSFTPSVYLSSTNLGDGMFINLSNTANNNTGLNVSTNGTGAAFKAASALGIGAFILNSNAANNNEAFNATTISNGYAAKFVTSNATNNQPTVNINNNGSGYGLESVLTNVNNNTAAVYGTSAGSRGIVGTALIYGVTGTSSATSGGVGVFGLANINSATGIGVKGEANSTVTTSGAVTGVNNSDGIGVYGKSLGTGTNSIGVKGVSGTGINPSIGVLGEGNSANPQAIGVKGTSYSHNEDVGAVMGINFTDGVGVYGEATGQGGIGVVGTVGNTGNNSEAAKFRNNYTNNTSPLVDLVSNGKNSAIFSDNSNLSNTSPIVHIRNAGTGYFLKLETNLGDIVTSVAKNGNIMTDGTITVKTDKGIVRNSTATQLRTEILTVNVPANNRPHYDDLFNTSLNIVVTFATAFSSPPIVTMGDYTTGYFQGVSAFINNVTNTGFTLRLENFSPYGFNLSATSVKVIAVGAE